MKEAGQLVAVLFVAALVVLLTLLELSRKDDLNQLWNLDTAQLPEWAQKDSVVLERCRRNQQFRLEVLAASHPRSILRLKKEAHFAERQDKDRLRKTQPRPR